MSIYATSARHAGKFPDEQHGGPMTKDERACVQSHIANYNGAGAIGASRDGVMRS